MKISVIKCGEMRKTITQKDLIARAKSIEKLGLLNPIIINENNEVIAGRTRFHAIKDILKWDEIPDGKIITQEGDDLAIEFTENYHRNKLSLGEELTQLQKITEILSIKEAAEIMGEAELFVKRRLNLKNLSKSFKRALKDIEFPKWKLEHYEIIASQNKEAQEVYYKNSFTDDLNDFTVKQLKADYFNKMVKKLDNLPWEEEGCGKCDFCKARKEGSLFAEMEKENKCSNVKYLNKKHESWINSLHDIHKITADYYTQTPGVLSCQDYTIDGKDGEEAIYISGDEIGKKVKINITTTTNKKTKISLEELKARKEKQRLTWIVEEKIIPKIGDIFKIKNVIIKLISIYGIDPLLKAKWDRKKEKFVYIFDGEFTETITDLPNLTNEKEIISEFKNALKDSIIKDLRKIEKEKVKFVMNLIKLDFEKIMEEAIENLPDPKSWERKIK